MQYRNTKEHLNPTSVKGLEYISIFGITFIQKIYTMLFFLNWLQLQDMLHDVESQYEISIDTCIMFVKFCIFAAELALLCERRQHILKIRL
ncbi:hypothetical protein KPH14_010083 [Odynerus spinipes]|uniref:Uncharacterized protein n=1 Tax=Odynerus spinipes TaxID=1348599 RepID=A0AAD9RT15_9HYME|nr:hypothetical protein KPH14_010083 [Odynerus spinipes]